MENYEENLQMIAYFDILGFKALLKQNQNTAIDFIETLKNRLNNKINDTLTDENSTDENNEYFIDSFKYFLNMSDSIIIISNQIDKFIIQVINFIKTIQIDSLKAFSKDFKELEEIENKNIADFLPNKTEPNFHKNFPFLLRGGIAFGKDIIFFPNNPCIIDSKVDQLSLNLTGKTYIEAVGLEEKTGKGPRIFFKKDILKFISNEQLLKMFKRVDNDIYEIVWTIKACEYPKMLENKKYDCSKENIKEAFLGAIHLFNHYKRQEDIIEKKYKKCNELTSCNLIKYKIKDEQEKYKKVQEQYKELIKLLACGFMKYAKDECDNKQEEALNYINDILQKNNTGININIDILDDFVK